MNSTNLYVTTTRIIMKSDPKNPNSWQDLYRLVPYLRNSLCCVVCSNLLVDPFSPNIAQCQHHLCRLCEGGRKKIKPACEECKDCRDYSENRRLRILLQCYKNMCSSLINSQLFTSITQQAADLGTSFESGTSNLILLIKEGAAFQDDYKSNGGLPKSAYSILPCIYSKPGITQVQSVEEPPSRTEEKDVMNSNVQNRSGFYSVLYPGNGSKITLKRKPKEGRGCTSRPPVTSKQKEVVEKSIFKKPCTVKPKKGCRCGNATATPGKLTCCGQRCPCYVDSKPCIECKCRGCRNPHRMDGQKVIPHIPELKQIHIMPPPQSSNISPDIHDVKLDGLDLDTRFTPFEPIGLNQTYKTFKVVGGYNHMPLSPDLLPLGFNEEESEISVV